MLHTGIIQKLDEKGFPDFSFFNDEKTLLEAEAVLEKLLEKEKAEFEALMQKKNEDISFDDFEDDSLLDYFWSILEHLNSVDASPLKRQIIENFMPKLQDFGNEVAFSKPYYEKTVYLLEHAELGSDQKRVLSERKKAFEDRGIALPKEKQDEIKKISKELGELSQAFTNNVVDDKALFRYTITDFESIKDLPKAVLDATKKAYEDSLAIPKEVSSAKTLEKEGWLFTADPTQMQAIMKYCHDPKIRADFEQASSRFASEGAYDNRKNILKILQLKEKKAKLLGYNNYGELSLNSKMADSPEQIFAFIGDISKKSKIKAKAELEALKEYFKLEKLETYDIAYYTRKLKEEKYELDEEELKNYFELENVLSYMFELVEKLYGIEIREVTNQVKNHPSPVGEREEEQMTFRAYEVYKNDRLISYYFMDLFYRPSKRPGAWANNLRSKYLQNEKLPVVLNVCNFMKQEGKTTLYLRDVETIFHEFGHALHEMLSESPYSSLSGFGVEWDFVELPSQLMENWVSERESMKRFAKHAETGETIPEHFLEKLEALKTFMSGNFVARQNEFALLDMSFHTETAPKTVAELDEKNTEFIKKYSIHQRDENYRMYASFGHIFGGGYAAGYYSYMWAELLEADVWERIKEMGMFERETGKKLFSTIIGQGCRKEASELFFDFMGREPKIDALMKRYGMES